MADPVIATPGIPLDIPDDEPKLPDAVIDLSAEDDDTPPPAAEPEPKPKRKVILPDEGIAKLKADLEAEKRAKAEEQQRRQVAEARAASAEQTAAGAQKEAADNRLHLVNASIISVTQTLDAAEAQLADAIATGDHAAAAKINRQMATEGARLAQLEATKQHLENTPPPRPMRTVDKAERFAQTLAPRAAAWVRSHPEFVNDDRLNRKLTAAHNLALADNLREGSDEYFEALEATLKIRQPEPAPEPTPIHDTAPQRATGGRTVAAEPRPAPVSRSGTGNGSAPLRVTLTGAEREAARMSGLTDREYAKNKLEIEEMKRRGELN